MKRLFTIGLALVICTSLGCSSTSTTGGDAAGKSFKLNGPATATTIKQGTTQTIELSLSRDKEFKEDVTLKAEAPKGLTATVKQGTVKASEDIKPQIEVKADKDAAIGEHTIKITGTPAKGSNATTEFKVKVEKGE